MHHSFGGVQAVDGCSFTIAKGALAAVIGPNGAGKSTMVNVVSGALPRQRGRIRFDGSDISGWAPHRIALRGLIRTFQISREFGGMTVLENLLVTAQTKGGSGSGTPSSVPRWGAARIVNWCPGRWRYSTLSACSTVATTMRGH